MPDVGIFKDPEGETFRFVNAEVVLQPAKIRVRFEAAIGVASVFLVLLGTGCYGGVGCHVPYAHCSVYGGAIVAEPVSSSSPGSFCDWNGRRERVALVVGTEDLKVVLQLGGKASDGQWAVVAWSGAPPSFTDSRLAIDAADQPLTTGQAALFARIDGSTSTVDAPSVGGGSVSLVGEDLPSDVGRAALTTLTFLEAQLAPVAEGVMPVVNGDALLSMGLTYPQ